MYLVVSQFPEFQILCFKLGIKGERDMVCVLKQLTVSLAAGTEGVPLSVYFQGSAFPGKLIKYSKISVGAGRGHHFCIRILSVVETENPSQQVLAKPGISCIG